VKIFLSAFACEPGRGSEPGVGYAFAVALARLKQQHLSDCSAILLTRPHTTSLIEHDLERLGLRGYLDVRPIQIPTWLVTLTKRRRVRFAYLYWQWAVLRTVQQEIAESQTDIVFHHVTFATEALPSAIAWMPDGVRTVFGPAGSSQALNESMVAGHYGWSRVSWRIRTHLREYIAFLNLRNSDLLIAATDDAAQRYKHVPQEVRVEPNCVVEPSSALSPHISPVQLVSVGLLISRKRHDLVIRALATRDLSDCRLTIYGDGPEYAALRQLAKDLGVGERVELRGWVDREAMLKGIAKADCLVSASRQEGSAWSVAEAQALGVSVVAIAGSGADTAIRLAGQGELAASDSDEIQLAKTVRRALDRGHPEPSNRWSSDRLPQMMFDWYRVGNVDGP